MNTWDVFGHDWAVEMLQQHVAHQSLRHAYLLTGPSGVGRRALALRLAQALNCQSLAAPGVPCKTCRTCKQIEAGQNVDLMVIQAESEGGTLKVEQVREVQKFLSLKPYQSPYKTVIFLRFQEANANAQNALLKTLEEAPARVILLLTADSGESLLPTIVSRCEVLRLRPLSAERLQDELLRRGFGGDDARLLARVSGGRMGHALRMHEDPGLLENRTRLAEDLFMLLGQPLRARFAYAESLAKEKEQVREAFLTWLTLWRDVILAASEAGLPLANSDLQSPLMSIAAAVGFAEARRQAAGLEQALARLDSNVNARLLGEVTLLDWPFVRV